MLTLGGTCLFASMLSGEDQIVWLAICLFLLNLFSAVQDVAVDSLAVNILDEDELGAGNTVQVVAYKFGSMFSGGLLLFIKTEYGWTPMFVLFASIYFICVALVSLQDVEALKTKTDSKTSHEPKPHDSVLGEVKELFSIPGTLWLTSFVLSYKLCESQAFTIYLVDKKVPTEELAVLSTIVRGCSIFGSFFSGYAITSLTARPVKLLVIISVIRALTVTGLATIVIFWGLEPQDPSSITDWCFKMLGFFLLCIFTVCAGAITTPTFTLMMSLSQKAPDRIRGTHFSFLATSEILGKLMFATVTGWLIDFMGLPAMYVLFTMLASFVPIVVSRAPDCIAVKKSKDE